MYAFRGCAGAAKLREFNSNVASLAPCRGFPDCECTPEAARQKLVEFDTVHSADPGPGALGTRSQSTNEIFHTIVAY